MDIATITKNTSISFEDAQALCTAYSPLKTNRKLYTELANILPSLVSESNLEDSSREIYNYLLYKFYPNEMTIKAAFSNQFFFDSDKHVAIYELKANGSRVDMCKINGTSIAYEIKTDLDNFQRLTKQLNDYSNLFEKIYLICSESRLPEVEELLPDHIGIYTYRHTTHNEYRFKLEKHALHNEHLDSERQLCNLTRADLLPLCPPDISDKNEMISYILNHYSQVKINRFFKESIKNNYRKNWDFIYQNHENIFSLDYQWFFQNKVTPELIYQ